MEDFLVSLPKCQVQVDGNIVDATTGFAACEFAESVEADLLVLPGYNRPQGPRAPTGGLGAPSRAVQSLDCAGWCGLWQSVVVTIMTSLKDSREACQGAKF